MYCPENLPDVENLCEKFWSKNYIVLVQKLTDAQLSELCFLQSSNILYKYFTGKFQLANFRFIPRS